MTVGSEVFDPAVLFYHRLSDGEQGVGGVRRKETEGAGKKRKREPEVQKAIEGAGKKRKKKA